MIDHLHKIKVKIEGSLDNITPHDCPVCKLVMRDINDIVSYENWECCTDCRDQFVFLDKDAWQRGVRPDEEKVRQFRDTLRARPSYLIS